MIFKSLNKINIHQSFPVIINDEEIIYKYTITIGNINIAFSTKNNAIEQFEIDELGVSELGILISSLVQDNLEEKVRSKFESYNK